MVAEPVDPQLDDLLAAKHSEQLLIGAMLIDRDAIATVAEWLKPGAFADPTWRQAYEAILVCWRDRVPPDVATVRHGYQALGVPFLEIPFATLSEAIITCPFACHAPHYAAEVAAAAKRRAVAQLGLRMVQGAFSGAFDYEAAYREAMEEIENLSPDDNAIGPQTYADTVPDARDKMLRSWAGELPRRETDLGFRVLRRPLKGGILPGDLVILAGRPGMGKSAMGLQFLHNIGRAYPNEYCLIFSNEMSRESLIERAITEVSGVPTELVETGKVPVAVQNRILESTAFLETMPIAIDDTGGITTAQLLMRIQRFQRRYPVRTVLFDYVELAGDSKHGKQGEAERINDILRSLKQVAMTTKTSVIALSQLSRNVENRSKSDRTPNLSDLRYGGEAEADRVMMLYRPEYYDKSDRPGECDVIIAKQRNGETGTFTVRFHKELMTFTDVG